VTARPAADFHEPPQGEGDWLLGWMGDWLKTNPGGLEPVPVHRNGTDEEEEPRIA